MKKIIFLALIFLFAVAQSTLVNGLRIFGIKPDLLWIIAMAGALYFDFPAAVVFGAVCGFLKDCMGAQPLGIYVVALPLWCVVVRGISRRVSFDYISVSALFLAIMILQMLLLYAGLLLWHRAIFPSWFLCA